MARFSPSIAKNAMTRAMRAIIDPLPSAKEIDQLWDYFDGQCAYCGCTIDRASRTGHLDHVIAAAEGGSNSIFNFILACAKCNGDLKRETPWQEFLQILVTDPTEQEKRQTHIQDWIKRAPNISISPEAEAIIHGALESFDRSVTSLRALK